MQTSNFRPRPMLFLSGMGLALLGTHCGGEECGAGTSEACETSWILM
ncbi:MAG: hypothetical protein AAFQ65_12170 [Myxococcota bacterium]